MSGGVPGKLFKRGWHDCIILFFSPLSFFLFDVWKADITWVDMQLSSWSELADISHALKAERCQTPDHGGATLPSHVCHPLHLATAILWFLLSVAKLIKSIECIFNPSPPLERLSKYTCNCLTSCFKNFIESLLLRGENWNSLGCCLLSSILWPFVKSPFISSLQICFQYIKWQGDFWKVVCDLPSSTLKTFLGYFRTLEFLYQ